LRFCAYVFEDPRIGQVEDLLPKSNCGACGQAGCRDFAEKVVGGDTIPAKCTVSSPQQRQGIADLLGVAAGTVDKQVARLACAGGSPRRLPARALRGHQFLPGRGHGVRRRQGLRLGLPGPGRLRQRLHLQSHPHGRTACRSAIRQLHRLQRLRRGLPQGPVQPRTRQPPALGGLQEPGDGDEAEAECERGICTACGKCVRTPPRADEIRNNLAVVDYTKNSLATASPSSAAPPAPSSGSTPPGGQIEKGDARKVICARRPSVAP
jgi:electron transport complex protein RnfB